MEIEILILTISGTTGESKRKERIGRFQEEEETKIKSLTRRWREEILHLLMGLALKEGKVGRSNLVFFLFTFFS
jgi:hypothetical protein